MSAPQMDSPVNRESSSPDYAETISRLFRKHSFTALQKVLSRLFPSDLARILDGYTFDEAAKIFFLIPSHRLAASTLKYVSSDLRNHLMQEYAPEKLLPILEELPPDDRADIIGHLDSALAKRFMGGLDEESMREVEDLLQYDADTAGGLMTPEFFALSVDTTVGAAIDAVRSLPYFEMVFYLYVLDDKRRLVGVSSLRQLILNDPSKTLAEIMNSRTIKVLTNTPSSEVAEMVRRYRLLGVPVVDDMDVLVGVITVDDVISTMEQDITEDVLKSAGAPPPEVVHHSLAKNFSIRLPWLLLALLGALLTGAVIHYFTPLLEGKLILAAFLPLVMNMTGNMATSTAAASAKALANKAAPTGAFKRLFLMETSIGLVLGSLSALLGGLATWQLLKSSTLGQIVAISILINSLLGILLTLFFAKTSERLRSRPEFFSGRISRPLLDLLGVAIYFSIAKVMLGG
ncbi:magnesium transporter [Candidatus Magnetaquicoccus inordinatus]|uniref:magnesium transporter n=1 Tax=Candidatus Magnetaquicoccus inordinatus TaxID=2496818 RepID=UPI00102B384A|nr:magnesium transporter [Candidatus Magnetaquicoccus inordinatus]